MTTHVLPSWPVVLAKHFTARPAEQGARPIRLIVLHTMEAPEKGETAEAVAKFFAKGDRKASAHLCVDNNSIVRCVEDNDIAWGAKGANSNGLHVEMAGSFRQTAEQWNDQYSLDVVKQAALAVAHLCIKHGLPVDQLSNDDILAKKKGICGHSQIVEVFPEGQVASEHRDPGEFFPWDEFIREARAQYVTLTGG